jgi:hypothetical protein
MTVYIEHESEKSCVWFSMRDAVTMSCRGSSSCHQRPHDEYLQQYQQAMATAEEQDKVELLSRECRRQNLDISDATVCVSFKHRKKAAVKALLWIVQERKMT